MIEQDTRHIIDNNLVNKGWILNPNNSKKNVILERAIYDIVDIPELRKSKLSPDYTLLDDNRKPIAVIEAKAGGKNLKKAIEQAIKYTKLLKAPLIFAMNNSYCQTYHLEKNKPLYINGNEVN